MVESVRLLFRESRVVISLTPDALEGAYVVGSRVVRTACQSLDRSEWSDAWDEGLLAYDEPLRRMLADLNVRRGAQVAVLVQSPSDAVEVASFPSSGPEAVQAAMLGVEERVIVHDSRAVSDGMVIAHDEHDGSDRTHVLACAADNDSVQAVFGWVSRSGNRLVSHVPRAVVPLISTLEAAEAAQGCVAYCYLDWTTATIASMYDGSLSFVRTFNAGYQSLAEAYARGLARMRQSEQPEEDDERPSLDLQSGSRLLLENGVPSREARIGDSDNPYRTSVAPLLASVMQRLSVEIKQSVRYGVRAVEQRPRRLVILGPGARIPGMASLLSDTTELDVEIAPYEQETQPINDAFAPGSTEHIFATTGDPGISLIPIAAVERLASAARSSAVRAGVILSVGLLLGEAGLISLERGQIAAAVAEQQHQLDAIRSNSQAIERAAEQIEELNVASYASAIVAGDQPDWNTVIGDLGARTPEQIRIRDVRAFYEGAAPIIAIGGLADDAANKPGGDTLSGYIEGLKQSPFVHHVELGTTRTETLDGVTMRSFSLRCQLHAVPFAIANPGVFNGTPPKALADAKAGRP